MSKLYTDVLLNILKNHPTLSKVKVVMKYTEKDVDIDECYYCFIVSAEIIESTEIIYFYVNYIHNNDYDGTIATDILKSYSDKIDVLKFKYHPILPYCNNNMTINLFISKGGNITDYINQVIYYAINKIPYEKLRFNYIF
jgi:hypothetical protein